MEIKNSLKLYILAQGADSAPPLGTILGNFGINSIIFCQEFNKVTSDLPNFLTLAVTINVFSNKSYNFFIEGLPLSPLFLLLSNEVKIFSHGKRYFVRGISLKNFVKITKFHFPKLSLKRALPIALGVLRTTKLVVF